MSHRPKRGARHTRPDAPETPHPAADLSQRASALSRWRGWLTALGVVLALLDMLISTFRKRSLKAAGGRRGL